MVVGISPSAWAQLEAFSALRSRDHVQMNIVEVARVARRVVLVMDCPGKPLQDTPVATPIDCHILLGGG